jgi:hypothetical protein
MSSVTRPEIFGITVQRRRDGLVTIDLEGAPFDDCELDWIINAIQRVRQELTDLVEEDVDRD